MLLSDRDLIAAITDESLRLHPAAPGMVQPASIDVRLNRRFVVFRNHVNAVIDPRRHQPDLSALVEVAEGDPFVLHPGEFVLGSTEELVQLDNTVAARLEGKSSLGRLGLLVHSTAGFIDPGFRGRVTLELSNVNRIPILLWPGDKIGQLCVFRLTSPADRPYGSPGLGSRYQDQHLPTASRSWLQE